MFDDPVAIQTALAEVQLPNNLSDWLARLRLLKGVPFNYVVPDEGMLPPESIRFFYVDMNWVDALLDGALSIGRNLTTTASAASMNLDAAVLPQVHPQVTRRATGMRARALGIPAPEATLQVVSGFLLRSSIVSAYKGIGANVYPKGGTPADGEIQLLTVLRFEALGPNSDTLICLVDGDAYRVDVHEAPEHLHYGIDRYVAQSNQVSANKFIHTFTKTGSNVSLTKDIKELDLSDSFRSNSPRVLKMTTLAGQIASQNTATGIDSAEMGFEMTEGVGMVSFKKESSA
jgi:hypothetical protein